ncbi:hypothetical protein [Kibdelosporangium philippinense]|uniref:hypothetical protein n=1 Tax=Kibdelosporangium philippinense TaxID=211113 RepID=UPI00360E39A9
MRRLTHHQSGDENSAVASVSRTQPVSATNSRRARNRGSLQRRAARHPSPVRFSTVWPCAQDTHLVGTGLLADWLLTAVIKIITTYSTPGDRVLLLAPSPLVASRGIAGLPATRAPRRPGPYAGLLEAAWPVVRLGRGVQTAITRPPDEPRPGTPSSADRSESGPGFAEPDPDHTAFTRIDASVIISDSGERPDGLFDVIITAAESRTLARTRVTAWSRLLTPAGILAAITHSDHNGPWLQDSTGALVRAAQQDGLRYLDHIALVRIPIKHSALDGPARASGNVDPSSDPAGSPARGARAHADLYVFGRSAPVSQAVPGRGDIG